MAFKTIHTLYGLTTMAQAEATGTPINLTHMAVGDGGGSPVDPSDSQTALVNERWRTTVNTVYNDPSNPLGLVCRDTDSSGCWRGGGYGYGGWPIRCAGCDRARPFCGDGAAGFEAIRKLIANALL